MSKKILLGFIASLVVFELAGYIVHSVILGSTYESLKSLWRPDMMEKTWIYQVIMVIGAFFFTFIFSKGYEGKGIMEGVRYGLYIGIWMSVGMAYGTYGMIDIPYSMALTWFVCGVVEYVIAGIVLALVFKKKKEVAAA